jgi:hypothetical protein
MVIFNSYVNVYQRVCLPTSRDFGSKCTHIQYMEHLNGDIYKWIMGQKLSMGINVID